MSTEATDGRPETRPLRPGFLRVRQFGAIQVLAASMKSGFLVGHQNATLTAKGRNILGQSTTLHPPRRALAGPFFFLDHAVIGERTRCRFPAAALRAVRDGSGKNVPSGNSR